MTVAKLFPQRNLRIVRRIKIDTVLTSNIVNDDKYINKLI